MIVNILAWFTLIVYGFCLIVMLFANIEIKNRALATFLTSIMVLQSALTLFG